MEKPQPTSHHKNHRHHKKRRNNWEAKNRRVDSHCSKRVKALVPAKPLCSVCQQVEQPKYKCPKCHDTYCSIQCCRDHKEKGCSTDKEKPEESKENTATSKYLPREELNAAKLSEARNTSNNHADQNQVDDDLEPGWRITNEMKEAMQNSDWLKNELKDAGLRQIISSIIAAPNVAIRNKPQTKQQLELDKAKQAFPQFKRFIDKLLVTTGVMERQGPCAEMDLNEWLKEEKDLPSGSLVLKGGEGRKPRVAKINLKEESTESSSDEDVDSSSEEEDSSSSSSGEEN